MRDWQIEASAPGKIVLTGEYAVLAGAPALVAAVDRRVTCRLAVRRQGGWRLRSQGFVHDQTLTKAKVYRAPPSTLAGVARQILPEADAPAHLDIAIDSSPCYRRGKKLGIGSSAATVTALATALAALRGKSPTLAELIDLHAGLQGGGSGLDVAAAFSGGIIRYQDRGAAPVHLPEGLAKQVVFCGEGTATAERVAAFNTWRGTETPMPLSRLADAAATATASTADAATFAQAFGHYADELARFDNATGLGILGPRHQRVRDLAEETAVYYKPCGAGGNDIGLALSANAAAMARFASIVRSAALAEKLGITLVEIEFSASGVDHRDREGRTPSTVPTAHRHTVTLAR